MTLALTLCKLRIEDGRQLGWITARLQDVLAACMEESRQAQCCIVAGTSATVYPAAQIPIDVLHRGGVLVELNLYESEITRACAVSLRGAGAATLVRLVETVRRLSGTASH